jgi:uncharacterized protein (TIGR02996 family)
MDTEKQRAFLMALAQDSCDVTTRLVYVDWLEENEEYDAAFSQRKLASRTPVEGDRVVTISNHGSTSGRYSRPIRGTSIYVARRRKADGVLTWRLERHLNDGTSGSRVTRPQVARAKAEAERLGLLYVPDIRQDRRCEVGQVDHAKEQANDPTSTVYRADGRPVRVTIPRD